MFEGVNTLEKHIEVESKIEGQDQIGRVELLGDTIVVRVEDKGVKVEEQAQFLMVSTNLEARLVMMGSIIESD